MSTDCYQCQNITFFPTFSGNLQDFEAEIHTDVASLEACATERACYLCVVLHGILANRKRFGPTGRQSVGDMGPRIFLSLHYEGGDEESSEWEFVEDPACEEEDQSAPRNVVFMHPLGSDDLSIRNRNVLAKSAWYSETEESLPVSTITTSKDPSDHVPRTPPNTSTGSDGSMDLAKDWIRACGNTHKNCQPGSKDVPTRLLDVSRVKDTSTGIIHLVDSRVVGPVQYVTLSHRWNPSYNYFTTTSNLEAHLARGMDISNLPKTFAEACVTTSKLGFGYLWIDSLCIIQDSGEDKGLEIPKMADYYQNAELNLSASTESLGALWSDRDALSTKPFVLSAMLNLPGRSKSIALELAPVLRADKSHLDYRGWILQERIFPRRTLFFDAYWLSFECCAMSASESCPQGVNLSASSNLVVVDNSLATSLERDCNLSIMGGLIKHLDVATQSGILCLFRVVSNLTFFRVWERPLTLTHGNLATKKQTLSLWYRILNEYSLRQLSFETDRLNAISGLAERLSMILKDDYIGGMWRNSLIECLQWRPDDPFRGSAAIRQVQYRAPTWSWASCELLPRSSFRDSRRSLPLRISNEYVNGSESSAVVEMLDVQWTCEGLNKFGNLARGASLALRGRPLRGFAYTAHAPDMELDLETLEEKIREAPSHTLTRAARWESQRGDRALTWLHISGSTEEGKRVRIVYMVSPDTSDHKVEGYVYLLPLAERWLAGGGDSLFCLVLKEAGEGTFERIGHSVTRSCNIITAETKVITLI